MITCREVIELLLELVADELPPHHRAPAETHLRCCRDCHAYWESYQLLIRWSRRLGTVPLPPEVAQRLARRWESVTVPTAPEDVAVYSRAEELLPPFGGMTMQLPLQIAFHNLEPSEELAAIIRANAAKLDEFYNHIMSCRVVVDVPHLHHEEGNLFQIRIDLTVPGGEIVVNREPSLHAVNKNFIEAVRDAFDAARRQLEDFARRQRRVVKHHEPAPHAKVSRLFPEEGYGFIATPDGREVYFHQDSVLHGAFAHLQIGTEVTFVEEQGEKGAQASTVHVVGRHHHER
jgi:cold shock CspA family protein